MSDVEVWEDESRMTVTARGGSRRERGAAVVRGRNLELITKTYSETYGFQSATYTTYGKDS